MSNRFVSNLLLLLAAGFLVASALVFGVPTVGWLGLGVSAGAIGLTLLVVPLTGRGNVQRALDALVIVLAGWEVVASRVFSGATERWLTFAAAAALAALATLGLALHEAAQGRRIAHRATGAARDGHAGDGAEGNGAAGWPGSHPATSAQP